MMKNLLLFFCLLPIKLLAQENIYGEYSTWFLVSGYKLAIKPENKFTLTDAGNVLDKRIWYGTWTRKVDSLFLDFDVDSMKNYVHIVESEFLIRTNLKKSINTPDSFIIHAPAYLYKEIGYYENGQIRCRGKWLDVSTMNITPKRANKWEYFYENGMLKRVELYEKGKLNGEIINYEEDGICSSIEIWRKGKFIRLKNLN
jgi:hypothetical protein